MQKRIYNLRMFSEYRATIYHWSSFLAKINYPSIINMISYISVMLILPLDTAGCTSVYNNINWLLKRT